MLNTNYNINYNDTINSNFQNYSTTKNDIYILLIFGILLLFGINLFIFFIKPLFIKYCIYLYPEKFINNDYSYILNIYKVLIFELFIFQILLIIIFSLIFRKNTKIFKSNYLKYIFALQVISILSYQVLMFVYISKMPFVSDYDNESIKNNMIHDVFLNAKSIQDKKNPEYLKCFDGLVQQYCIVSSIIACFYSLYLIISVYLSQHLVLNIFLFITYHFGIFFLLLNLNIFSIHKEMSKIMFFELISLLQHNYLNFNNLNIDDDDYTGFEKILYFSITIITQILISLSISSYVNYFIHL